MNFGNKKIKDDILDIRFWRTFIISVPSVFSSVNEAK